MEAASRPNGEAVCLLMLVSGLRTAEELSVTPYGDEETTANPPAREVGARTPLKAQHRDLIGGEATYPMCLLQFHLFASHHLRQLPPTKRAEINKQQPAL